MVILSSAGNFRIGLKDALEFTGRNGLGEVVLKSDCCGPTPGIIIQSSSRCDKYDGSVSGLFAEGFGQIETVHSRKINVQYGCIKSFMCSSAERRRALCGHRDVMSPTLNQPCPVLRKLRAIVHDKNSESLHLQVALDSGIPCVPRYTESG